MAAQSNIPASVQRVQLVQPAFTVQPIQPDGAFDDEQCTASGLRNTVHNVLHESSKNDLQVCQEKEEVWMRKIERLSIQSDALPKQIPMAQRKRRLIEDEIKRLSDLLNLDDVDLYDETFNTRLIAAKSKGDPDY